MHWSWLYSLLSIPFDVHSRVLWLLTSGVTCSHHLCSLNLGPLCVGLWCQVILGSLRVLSAIAYYKVYQHEKHRFWCFRDGNLADFQWQFCLIADLRSSPHDVYSGLISRPYNLTSVSLLSISAQWDIVFSDMRVVWWGRRGAARRGSLCLLTVIGWNNTVGSAGKAEGPLGNWYNAVCERKRV